VAQNSQKLTSAGAWPPDHSPQKHRSRKSIDRQGSTDPQIFKKGSRYVVWPPLSHA